MRILAGAALAALIATSALAQAPASSGPTVTLPADWTRKVDGPVQVLQPPETDTHLAIVEVGAAADAKAAAASAWKLYRGGESHPFKLLQATPAREGWDEQAVVAYETSPNEHLAIQSIARRKGQAWTVVILDGSQATVEKRSGPMGVILQSLRPAGYARETFAGRTAHPLDQARIQALLDFVRTAAEETHTPGVGIALIDHGKIVYEGGVGVREAGKPQPVDAHTRFMIASNTKGLSTLLLAKLVDEGKLNWDQPVTQVYPAFRLGSEATTRQVLVRHLVCACTGVPRKDYEWVFNTTAKTPTAATFQQLAATEPTSKFGEVFQYNNLMATAAGFIGAHLVYPNLELGQAYDQAMQAKIFGPLGMKDTTFSMATALAGDHASPHGQDMDGKLRVLRQDINYAIAPFRPAGGAWSSPHDMILYVQNELTQGVLPDGKRFISAEALLARRARGVPISEDQWYGMGLMEDARWRVPVIHHGGDLSGYHSDWFAIPSAQVGAVILTNADEGVFIRGPFMRRLLELMYDGRPEAAEDVASAAKRVEAGRAVERKRLILPIVPADAAGLAQAYASPDLGRLTVEKAGGVVRIRTAAWSSEVASRHNDDGTVSLVTADPEIEGLAFVVGSKDGKRTLTTRDGQHAYVFVETAS
ncbi:MAG: serine hydrolase domain-containing protein [Phenylobacterium sp.]